MDFCLSLLPLLPLLDCAFLFPFSLVPFLDFLFPFLAGDGLNLFRLRFRAVLHSSINSCRRCALFNLFVGVPRVGVPRLREDPFSAHVSMVCVHGVCVRVCVCMSCVCECVCTYLSRCMPNCRTLELLSSSSFQNTSRLI